MKGPNVFLLVKRLTEEEKKLVENSLLQGKKANALLEIFDLINNASNLEDFNLKRLKLRKTTNQYFTQYSSKLFNIAIGVIQKNLTGYQFEKEFYSNYSTILILIEKKLYPMAEVFIQKLYDLIQDAERYEFYVSLSHLELKLKVADFENYKDGFQLKDKLLKLNELSEYSKTFHVLMHDRIKEAKLYYSRHLTIDEKNEIAEDLAFIDSNQLIEVNSVEKSKKLQIAHLFNQVIRASNTLDWNEGLKKCFLLIEAYQNHGIEKYDYTLNYWSTLNNCIILMTKSGDFSKFDLLKAYLRECEDLYLDKTDPIIYLHKKVHSHASLVFAHNTLGDFKGSKKIIQELKPFLDKQKYPFLRDLHPYISLHITLYYFNVRDFEKALEWNIKNDESTGYKRNHRYFNLIRLLEILIHCEIENFELVNNLFRSYRRGKSPEFKNERIENELKLVIPKMVQQNLNTETLTAVIQRLEAIPEATCYFDNLNLLAWLKSKSIALSEQNIAKNSTLL
jgi:hypothetical protein